MDAFTWSGRSAQRLAQPVALPYTTRLPGPITDYGVLGADGRWGHEYILTWQPVPAEGWRHLHTAGRSAHPVKPFAVVHNRVTQDGLALLVAYSGNYLIELRPAGDQVELTVRCSPAGAERLTTLGDDGQLPVPGALVSAYHGHWDYGTLPIRRYVRERLRRPLGDDWPPVQYNDWYYHSGQMSEASLLRCAQAAAEVGCELFTVDAGWYGSRPDWNFLGEWTVNRERFPQGLDGVVKGVRGLGLRFGLWIEIECAHPDAPVVREHPDWALPGMDRGGRVVLNLGLPAVRQHIIETLDRLIEAYALDYLKMDFNTDCSRGSEGYAGGDDPLLAHYRGLIEVWRHLRTTHPRLIVENCSSGSLRQDAMSAALTDTHWVSDEVANHLNLALNYGATALFPPEIGSHWTIAPDDPKGLDEFDLAARFRANFTGHFGLSGDIAGWTPQTRALLAREIAWYKGFRGHLGRADVYHLTPPPTYEQPAVPTALQYLDPANGRSVVLAFRGAGRDGSLTARLRELRPDTTYAVTGAGAERRVSGRELLTTGLTLGWSRPGQSALVEVLPVNE